MGRPTRSMHMEIVDQRELEDNAYRVTIAANRKVRQPPELDLDGLSIENYSRNPVVMWAHDAVGRSPSGGLPIGRTLSIAKAPGGRIVADFEFLTDDPFAQRVKNAWDKGFLRAASISWIPVESVPVDGTWRDTRSDLLEWSIVSVPADPDALRESHRRLMDAFLAKNTEGKGVQEPVSEPAVQTDLEEARAILEDTRRALGMSRAASDRTDTKEGACLRHAAGSL